MTGHATRRETFQRVERRVGAQEEEKRLGGPRDARGQGEVGGSTGGGWWWMMVCRALTVVAG